MFSTAIIWSWIAIMFRDDKISDKMDGYLLVRERLEGLFLPPFSIFSALFRVPESHKTDHRYFYVCRVDPCSPSPPLS